MDAKVNVLIGALLVPMAAATAGEPPDFMTIDKDKDGYLSRDEVRQVIPQILMVFDKVDANRDGKLDPAEYEIGLRVLAGQQS